MKRSITVELAARNLLSWQDKDEEFIEAAADYCADHEITQDEYERSLWDNLRAALSEH
jgi:hypothetical protein